MILITQIAGILRTGLLISSLVSYITTFAQSPIAYYPLDNHAKDVSGNNNNGAFNGDVRPTMDRYGNACGALHFDGKSAFIEVPSSPSLESPITAFTTTCWYRFDGPKQNTWLTVVCKGTTNAEAANNPQYRLQTQQNSAIITGTCSPTTPSASSTISLCTDFTKCDANFSAHPFETTGWNFYALVYDGNIVRVYMNDRKIFETNYTSSLQPNRSPLFIGMDDPGNREYFEGALDDIYLYNRALTETEITDLYNTNTSTVDWTKEEFQLSSFENKLVNLPTGKCSVKVSFDAPKIVASSCGKITVQQVFGPSSGSDFSPGKSLITFEAVSESGYVQNASFYIIIRDNLPPMLTVPRDTVIYITSNQLEIAYNYSSPVATDNCGVEEIKLVSGLASGSDFNVGRHRIRFQATDSYGNSTEKEFTVEIKRKSEQPLVAIPPSPPPTLLQRDSLKKIDTVIKISPLFADTTRTPKPKTPTPSKDILNYRPIDLTTRKNIELKTIVVEANVLKARVYDNAIYDGDTISLFLNKQPILTKKEVSPQGFSFEIQLDSSAFENELTVYAENLGRIPPNTGVLWLDDGTKQYSISLTSTLNTNGIIRIQKRK